MSVLPARWKIAEGENAMQDTLNAPVARQKKAKFFAIAPGQEKWAFLYVLISVAAIAWATTYSWIAGLAWWLAVPLVIACVIAGCAVIFSFVEVRRLARTPKEAAEEDRPEEPNPYTPRTVAVRPETGDAQVHHEYFPESAGLDQGQLTSQISGSTPLIEEFLNRRKKTA
jgi:hypothetical protein